MSHKAYEDTSVPAAKSKEQIEALLKKFAVQAVRFTSFPSYALLEFVRKEKDGRLVPYRVVIKPRVKQFARNATRELDQSERQVWRVAYWWLKSKIEAIDFGLVEFEQDFLPYMLVADNQGRSQTVSDVLTERLTGKMVTAPDDAFGGLHPALPSGGGV